MTNTIMASAASIANLPIQMTNTVLSGISQAAVSMGLPDVIPAGIPEISPASLPALPFDVSQLPAMPAGLPQLPAMPAGFPFPAPAAARTQPDRSKMPGNAYSRGGYQDGADQPAGYFHPAGTVAGNNLDFQVESHINQHYDGRKANSNSLGFEVLGA
jgi:hypothetical protein